MEKNKAVLFFEAFDFETHEKLCETFSNQIKNSSKSFLIQVTRLVHFILLLIFYFFKSKLEYQLYF